MSGQLFAYAELVSPLQFGASNVESPSPLTEECRSYSSPKNNFQRDSNRFTSQLMDESSNDFNSQQPPNLNKCPKVCGGCGEKINDRYLLFALDRYWHNSCLKCHCCGAMLADVGASCFTRRGLVLCKKDYFSMFGCSGICSGCGETIPPSEMVAKALTSVNLDLQTNQKEIHCVFHLRCFTCAKCGCCLRPGDRYAMLGANIVCEQDWNKFFKNSPPSNGSVPTRKGKVGRPRRAKD